MPSNYTYGSTLIVLILYYIISKKAYNSIVTDYIPKFITDNIMHNKQNNNNVFSIKNVNNMKDYMYNKAHNLVGTQHYSEDFLRTRLQSTDNVDQEAINTAMNILSGKKDNLIPINPRMYNMTTNTYSTQGGAPNLLEDTLKDTAKSFEPKSPFKMIKYWLLMFLVLTI